MRKSVRAGSVDARDHRRDPDIQPRSGQAIYQFVENGGRAIALDDFGTGYASIGALREFGFDRLKVDRSLIVALNEENDGADVLKATISLARALHIPVTAEGVETPQQAETLRQSGCDLLQGYFWAGQWRQTM
ncbi:EAL domain-containing protein [Rhizobium beringeri]